MKAIPRPATMNNAKHRVYLEIEGKRYLMQHGFHSLDEAKEFSDKVNESLASHVQSELSKTNAGYWKVRCEAAETVIKTGSQVRTMKFVEWENIKTNPEPSSELSTKIADIEQEFTDDNIRDNIGRYNTDYDFAVELRDKILKRLKGE